MTDSSSISCDEMRRLEQEAMTSGQASGLELMERAGKGVVAALFEAWPELDKPGCQAIIFCGPGNNGGDGYVVARLLQDRGWTLKVFCFGDPEKLPPDALSNYQRWVAGRGAVAPLADWDPQAEWQADILVDALFGTGLARPLDALSDLLARIDDAALQDAGTPHVVAVDIPSGLHADTGEVLVPSHGGTGAAHANLTVSFHSAKHGHLRGQGPEFCGNLVIADIGL